MATTKSAGRKRSKKVPEPEVTPYEKRWREKLANPSTDPALGASIASDLDVFNWLGRIVFDGGLLTPFERRVYERLGRVLGRQVMA